MVEGEQRNRDFTERRPQLAERRHASVNSEQDVRCRFCRVYSLYDPEADNPHSQLFTSRSPEERCRSRPPHNQVSSWLVDAGLRMLNALLYQVSRALAKCAHICTHTLPATPLVGLASLLFAIPTMLILPAFRPCMEFRLP